MIHILEYKNCCFDRNPDILLQYVNMPIILERLLVKTDSIGKLIDSKNYIHKEIFEGTELFDKDTLSDYIESNSDISILFFNADIFKNSITTATDSINYLCKKYPNIRFIVLTQETFLTYTKQSFDNKNVFYIINSLSNPYEYVPTISNMERVANYYIINTYLQYNYNTFLNSLFHQTRDLVRTKKYNFFNGIHKPHRLKCYEIIKNNNITACCNTFSNQLSLGKLENGIYNAWNSKLANHLRELHRCGKYYENPTCKKCIDNTSIGQ